MKKKVFIGNGFTQEQYLWLLPLIHGYLKEKKIEDILFERSIKDKKILNNPNLKFFFKNYNLNIIDEKKYLNIFLSAIRNVFSILKIFFLLRKKKILDKSLNWNISQILHGTWDQLNIEKKHNEKFNIIRIIKILVIGFYKFELGKKLKLNNVEAAFLSHSVYYERFLLASLRNANIKIFSQAVSNLHKQKKNKDVSWSDINTHIFKSFYRKNNLIQSYWKKRLKGKGAYQTANYSTKKNKNKKIDKSFNLILLHIFRDSPFNVIDRTRIFSDYYDWINSTLKLIKNSKENWLFKIHPAAKKWGEDQVEIFDFLIKKIYSKKPKNIVLVKNEYSNLYLIKSAKKIITYHGTAHIESICLGKKPIIIQNSPIGSISKKLYIKPKNIENYKNYLLSKDKSKFSLNKNDIKIGKTFLYIRENVNSLSSKLKFIEYYRNDSKTMKKKSFKSVDRTMRKNLKFFINQGSLLSKKQTHTMNLNL